MAGFRIPGSFGSTTSEDTDHGTMCRVRTPPPGPVGLADDQITNYVASLIDYNLCMGVAMTANDRKNASELNISEQVLTLLKQIETLRLKPYDDQTGKETKVWTEGATIGYGHLIKKAEWNTYKDGILEFAANTLFQQDLSPFVTVIRSNITAKLNKNEFDALVMLAFNIGSVGFKGSSVAKLVNDAKAKTSYENLEAAWKSWNKSQGKVMKGLENRRLCEWKVYSQGIYERW